MQIRIDDPLQPKVGAFLRAHLREMARLSPPESVHALPPEALRDPSMTLWTAWDEGELLGCGALKALSASAGEIKSMRTAERHLRTGVAARLLEQILAEARRRGYHRLCLETGSMEAFAPARALYERFGFEYCEPFAGYTDDPYSTFMSLDLLKPR